MRLALATLLLFLMAGPARADDVFCVQKPGCVGTSEPSLGAAIAAADADADLDRIEIGPVTLAERDLEAMQPLAIVGSGPSTVIDGADSSTPDTWVLRLHTATASIRDLKIHQTQTTNVTNYGLITFGAAIENLDFEGTGDHIVTAISTAGSTTQVRHLKVTLPTAGAGYANALQMDGGIAEDLGLDAPRGVLGNGTVRRARIRSRDGGIFVWDAMTVEHSLIESGLHSPTSQNWGIAAQGGDGRPASNVTVRNVTLLGHTGADSVGLMASTSTGGTDTINARNGTSTGWRAVPCRG